MSDRPADEKDPCAVCGLEDVIDGPDPGAHWTTPHSHVIAAWSCSEECSRQLELQRFRGVLEVRDPEWDGYASRRDLMAATIYNAQAQSPLEMTPARWARIKQRFGPSARLCLEQADRELEDM